MYARRRDVFQTMVRATPGPNWIDFPFLRPRIRERMHPLRSPGMSAATERIHTLWHMS
jgi:hypothetical protein